MCNFNGEELTGSIKSAKVALKSWCLIFHDTVETIQQDLYIAVAAIFHRWQSRIDNLLGKRGFLPGNDVTARS